MKIKKEKNGHPVDSETPKHTHTQRGHEKAKTHIKKNDYTQRIHPTDSEKNKGPKV